MVTSHALGWVASALLMALPVHGPGAARALAPATVTLIKIDPLSPMARQLLHHRMERHGVSMMQLVSAVTLLQRERAMVLSGQIADEARLLRPVAGVEADLNASLPRRFFELQDELRVRAQQLAHATTSPDNVALVGAMSRVMQTCVSCHAAFLEPNVGGPL